MGKIVWAKPTESWYIWSVWDSRKRGWREMQPNCEGPSELDFGAQTLSRAPGVSDGQGGLACCDSWGRKESDMTERLNGTELNS